jgi:phage-related protein
MNTAAVISTASSVISFIASHRTQLGELVTNVESMIPDAVGSAKAAAVKGFIGVAMNIEADLEAAWPLVSPIFNFFVHGVKAKPAVVPVAVPPADFLAVPAA